MGHVAYIALGSNIEPRAGTLIRALSLLDEHEGISVKRVSQMIQTEPVGPAGQATYLNGAAGLHTDLEPRALLAALQEIESQLGRDRAREQRWGPRTCDLDLLLYDDVVVDSEELTVPHPRMHERDFVLRPLAEIAAAAVHPVLKQTVAELLGSLEFAG